MLKTEREIVKQRLGDILGGGLMDIVPASDGFHNQVLIINKKMVARISSQNSKARNDLETELDLLMALDKAGVQVAKPITLMGHDRIIALEADNNAYWLTFFQHTAGRPVDVSNVNEWNNVFFHEWGKQIAAMHNVNTGELDRPVYLDSVEKNTRPMNDWLKRRHEHLLSQMVNWKRRTETFGLIHNDLHQGNFHLNENGLIFFDFDDCAYHFYAHDLAVSIYHALWTGTAFHPESKSFPVDFLSSLLTGYATSRRLTSEMYDQLLICLQMREVYLYALFVAEWNKDEMMVWQIDKLQELEENIKSNIIPYKEKLEKVRFIFE
jgi:Ser/Thr protein kinase RdoA (MazF antagonist)